MIVKVNASTPYEVVIDRNVLSQSGKLIRDVLPRATKALIVSDSNVAPLYLGSVKESLEKNEFEVFEFVFAAGESSKTLSTIASMYSVMAVNGFTRTDVVVGIGGGVTTDMAGFAAATFLRGIKVVEIPTSLLAQVDAAIGGKTGVDLPEGKNLVGAFCQPALVIEDIDTLETLSNEVFSEGMAEVIKYAFITDEKLYEDLAEFIKGDTKALVKIVEKCVQDKARVIEEDEFDNGRRQLLNFGHTIGHVIEKKANYQISHGVAVAQGMALMTKAADSNGISSGLYDALCFLLKRSKLPIEADISVDDIIDGVKNDKKKRGDIISVIISEKIGCAKVKEMTKEELSSFLRR